MANYDNPRGFWPCDPTLVPVEYLCATGETVAIGDAMIPAGGAGMTIALANSAIIGGGGVVCPQKNEAGAMVSRQGANLYTTSTAAVTVWLYPFLDPATRKPNLFYIQDDGTTAAAMLGLSYDITGGTGVMQLNTAGTTYKVLDMVSICEGVYVVDSSGREVLNEVGANGLAKVCVTTLQAA